MRTLILSAALTLTACSPMGTADGGTGSIYGSVYRGSEVSVVRLP